MLLTSDDEVHENVDLFLSEEFETTVEVKKDLTLFSPLVMSRKASILGHRS